MQYYYYTRSEHRAELSSMWIFLVCLPLLFFPPVSYCTVPLQSIDCFCSSCRFMSSLLASFALVSRHDCSCSSTSHPFRFSLSILSALLLARSASVRRLFLLFSSINSFSSRQFHTLQPAEFNPWTANPFSLDFTPFSLDASNIIELT